MRNLKHCLTLITQLNGAMDLQFKWLSVFTLKKNREYAVLLLFPVLTHLLIDAITPI